MKLTQDQKRSIQNGNTKILRDALSVELEDIKNQLLIFKAEKSDYDNVLKGRGVVIQEIITLLT